MAGEKLDYQTDNPRTYLEIKRSKVKIIRPINYAVIDNAPWQVGGNSRDEKVKVKVKVYSIK